MEDLAKDPVIGVVLAHEVLDALPVERIIYRNNQLLRQGVSIRNQDIESKLSFVDKLKIHVKIEVDTYDERLSSFQAKKSLIHQGVKTGHNKEQIDQTAAAIFLQGYLNSYESSK